MIIAAESWIHLVRDACLNRQNFALSFFEGTAPRLYLGLKRENAFSFMEQKPHYRIQESKKKFLGYFPFVDSLDTNATAPECLLWSTETFYETSLGPEDFSAFPETKEIRLVAQRSDDEYLEACSQCLEDIARGRYYQINLLRYFWVEHESFTEEELRWHFIQKMLQSPPVMGAVLQAENQFIASFSPERFVRWGHDSEFPDKISTYPIKGTRKYSANPWEISDKDRCELNIIIDLMRNDLNRICAPASVNVSSAGMVQNFGTIDHRIAAIHGILRNDLSFSKIMSRLLPSGSISGAPKKEVLAAIAAFEDRPRGVFMGNFFECEPHLGRFDSNVLIRTVFWDESANKFEYAAGSGITIASKPQQELEEINHKCLVLLAGAK